MRDQEQILPGLSGSGRATRPTNGKRDYHAALDRVMSEIEKLRGTAHPRLALAEERVTP